jgi:ankyrin repeat protein
MENKIFKKITTEVVQLIRSNNIEKLKQTILSFNTIDKDKRNLLHHAILSNNIEIVNWLIENNIDINCKDKNGWTPLHFAIQNHNIELVNILLKNNSIIIDNPDNYGNTPLWRAVYESKGRSEIIELLLSKGANPDLKNYYDISPIDLAKSISNYDVKKYFII